MSEVYVLDDLSAFDVEIVPVDQLQAEIASIRPAAMRKAGLSLGARTCLARALGATVVTADRAWPELDVNVRVVR